MAVWAMIAGIVALVLAIIPGASFIAGLPAVVAIVLGAIALVKKKPGRGKATTGLILGVLAVIVSFFVSVVFIGTLAAENSANTAPAIEPADEDPDAEPSGPGVSEEPASETPALINPTEFKEVDERTLALIVKDPDAHVGEQLVVYGSITQFDAATGQCSFLADTSHAQQVSSFDYSNNTLFTARDGTSDCPVADPLVAGDHIKAWVTVLGSFSYETQIGGSTTVPFFELAEVEILPPTEY